jgi:hypothetical protein
MSDRAGEYTSAEMMAVAAARRLPDGAVCFVGIGLPSQAANLALATHAPDCVLIYESGTIGARPRHLPLSIGDGELAETAQAVVPVPEVFAYWLQGGRIDVGFLGAAQIDRFGPGSACPGAAARPRSPPSAARPWSCSSTAGGRSSSNSTSDPPSASATAPARARRPPCPAAA